MATGVVKQDGFLDIWGFCNCGCSKPVENEGNRFINGHNSRVFPKEVRDKISNSLIGLPAWNRGLTKDVDERVEKYSKKLRGRKGHVSWNKGLTKETDPRLETISKKVSIAQIGKKINKNQLRGLEKGRFWCKGLTKETDNRLRIRSEKVADALKGRKNPEHSKFLKEFYKGYPEKHPNHIISKKGHRTYIEKLFGEYLEELNIKAHYNLKAGSYWIDWAIPGIKIGFECDGEQWHDAEKDEIRDRRLNKLGWKIYRFTGSQIVVNPIYCKHKVKGVMGKHGVFNSQTRQLLY